MADIKTNSTLCPFCLRTIPPRALKCTNTGCEMDLPRLYADDFQQVPLGIVSAVGFSRHGKTVYLAALLHVLDELSQYWPGYYRQALNLSSIDVVESNRKLLLHDGVLPNATPQNFPEPGILRLANMPDLGDRRLLVYDAAGESFQRDYSIKEYAGYVSRSPVALFFISVPLMIQDEGNPAGEMDKLLQIYILGMRALLGNTKKQHLVIVYTWGDMMEELLTEYPDVLRYLNRSELAPGWEMSSYIREMGSISTLLKSFTHRTLKASNFFNMALNNFASVECCMVSSLGRPPTPDGRLTMELSPRRVVDPLLWVITKTGV